MRCLFHSLSASFLKQNNPLFLYIELVQMYGKHPWIVLSAGLGTSLRLGTPPKTRWRLRVPCQVGGSFRARPGLPVWQSAALGQEMHQTGSSRWQGLCLLHQTGVSGRQAPCLLCDVDPVGGGGEKMGCSFSIFFLKFF